MLFTQTFMYIVSFKQENKHLLFTILNGISPKLSITLNILYFIHLMLYKSLSGVTDLYLKTLN